jgi:hypothetical protein
VDDEHTVMARRAVARVTTKHRYIFIIVEASARLDVVGFRREKPEVKKILAYTWRIPQIARDCCPSVCFPVCLLPIELTGAFAFGAVEP